MIFPRVSILLSGQSPTSSLRDRLSTFLGLYALQIPSSLSYTKNFFLYMKTCFLFKSIFAEHLMSDTAITFFEYIRHSSNMRKGNMHQEALKVVENVRCIYT